MDLQVETFRPLEDPLVGTTQLVMIACETAENLGSSPGSGEGRPWGRV